MSSAAHEEHHDLNDPRASHPPSLGGWNRRTVLGAAGSGFVLVASGLALPAAAASALAAPPVPLSQHHQAPQRRRRPRRDRRRDQPRGRPDQSRGIEFVVMNLKPRYRGFRFIETEFWIAQVPHPSAYKVRKKENINFGDLDYFSTTGPRAILWISYDCVVSVRIPNDGAPELTLGLGGTVARGGWQRGRTVSEVALSVGERAPVMRTGTSPLRSSAMRTAVPTRVFGSRSVDEPPHSARRLRRLGSQQGGLRYLLPRLDGGGSR